VPFIRLAMQQANLIVADQPHHRSAGAVAVARDERLIQHSQRILYDDSRLPKVNSSSSLRRNHLPAPDSAGQLPVPVPCVSPFLSGLEICLCRHENRSHLGLGLTRIVTHSVYLASVPLRISGAILGLHPTKHPTFGRRLHAALSDTSASTTATAGRAEHARRANREGKERIGAQFHSSSMGTNAEVSESLVATSTERPLSSSSHPPKIEPRTRSPKVTLPSAARASGRTAVQRRLVNSKANPSYFAPSS
jgi:hypothetical protein